MSYDLALVDSFPFVGNHVFALGCLAVADPVQYFGAAFIFAGVIGLFEKVWPEEELEK